MGTPMFLGTYEQPRSCSAERLQLRLMGGFAPYFFSFSKINNHFRE